MDKATFELKVELLFKGIRIVEPATAPQPGRAVDGATPPTFDVDRIARAGGAGPAGGMFATWHDAFQVNIPLQERMVARSDLVMEPPPASGPVQVFKENARGERIEHCRLHKIPAPSFYDDEHVPKERNAVGTPVPFRKIALVHGTDCVATTINQSCKYWRDGTQCRFCAIEASLHGDRSLAVKDPGALVAFTERAIKERRAKHFTLTTGTQDGPDGGALAYVPIVKALKEQFSLPVHVQFSPVASLDVLDKLHDAGVDNAGIHLETYPDARRHAWCPGKARIPLRSFERCWDRAVELFGPGQVESYLLAGLGETPAEFSAAVELAIAHEVIPFVVPARPIKNTSFQANTLPDHQALVGLYVFAGKRLHEQGLHPSRAVAGCVRCGACSAIGEAVKVAPRYP